MKKIIPFVVTELMSMIKGEKELNVKIVLIGILIAVGALALAIGI